MQTTQTALVHTEEPDESVHERYTLINIIAALMMNDHELSKCDLNFTNQQQARDVAMEKLSDYGFNMDLFAAMEKKVMTTYAVCYNSSVYATEHFPTLDEAQARQQERAKKSTKYYGFNKCGHYNGDSSTLYLNTTIYDKIKDSHMDGEKGD